MRGEKLRHQLAGHRAHRFGASSETAEQLQLALETSEIAAAAMTARVKLPAIEEKDKPKRRLIPDHIPRMEVELTPSADACADCGGRLRRIGEEVTEELEYVPGPSPLSSDQWRTMARHREPHRSPASDLFVLRAVRASPAALAAHRARPPWPGLAGP